MKLFAYILTAFFVVSAAQAAPILQIDGDGELVGAKEILIGGELFDVSFVDGSFVDIFGDSSGLDATSASDAVTFSTALADQIFNDTNSVYDLDSGKTLGCHNSWRPWCYIYTPFADIIGLQLSVGYFRNRSGANNDDDAVGTTATNRNLSTATFFPAGDYVYADWSASLTSTPSPTGAIPEPPAFILFGLGLLGLGAVRFSRQTSPA